jgi:hypothetical protein
MWGSRAFFAKGSLDKKCSILTSDFVRKLSWNVVGRLIVPRR